MAMNAERMALFSGGGNRNTNSSKALVEFRAGKMSMNGTLVTPDKRKGQICTKSAFLKKSLISISVKYNNN